MVLLSLSSRALQFFFSYLSLTLIPSTALQKIMFSFLLFLFGFALFHGYSLGSDRCLFFPRLYASLGNSVARHQTCMYIDDGPEACLYFKGDIVLTCNKSSNSKHPGY